MQIKLDYDDNINERKCEVFYYNELLDIESIDVSMQPNLEQKEFAIKKLVITIEIAE